MSDVNSLFALVMENFDDVVRAFESGETTKVERVLKESERSWELQRELRIKHFKRLNEGVQVSIETTEIHMDMLNDLHRINRHVYHIAQTLLELS